MSPGILPPGPQDSPEGVPPPAPPRALQVGFGLALLAIVVLGVWMRVGQRADEYWFNPDEAIYHQAATVPDRAFATEVVLKNSHPPLYFALLRAMALVRDDAAWLRLPSLVASVLGILALAWLAGRVGGRWAALAVATLVALAPGCVIQADLMRPYSLQVLLAGLTLVGYLGCLERGHLDRGSRGALVLFGTTLLLGVSLQYATWILAAGLGVHTLLLLLTRRLGWRAGGALFLAALPSALAMVGEYLWHVRPYLLESPLQREAQRTWLAPGFVTGIADVFTNVWGAVGYAVGYGITAAVLLVLLVGLVSAWARRRRDGMWRVVSLAPAVLAMAVLASAMKQLPLGGGRNCLYLLPVAVIPLAAGLRFLLAPEVASALLDRRLRLAGMALLAGLGVYGAATAWAGPKALTQGLWPELVTPRTTLEVVREALLARPDEVWITDAQTALLLMPLLPPVQRQAQVFAVEEPPLLHWDGRTFYVLDFWRLDPLAPARGGVLDRLLARLAAERGPQGRVSLLGGGWGRPSPLALAAGFAATPGFASDAVRDLAGGGALATASVDIAAWQALRALNAAK